MAGAALVVTGSPAGVPDSWRARMRQYRPLLVQLGRYAAVGGLGTAVNAAIFLTLRTGLDAVPANLVALVLSTAVSTDANRRFTFGAGWEHRWRAQVQVGATVLFYACYSSAVLLLLHVLVDDPSPVQESLAVAAASVLGGVGRFLVLRYWVFDTTRAAAAPARAATWQGGRMGRPSLTRTIAAVLAGAALFLTSAGACGGGEGDDEGDGQPGLTQQEDGGGDEGGDDEGGGGEGGGDEGGGEGGDD